MRAPFWQPTDEALDGRTRASRRYAALVAELSAKFGDGGPKSISATLRIRSAAAMIVRLESLQATAASGGEFNPAELSQLSELTAKAIHDAAPPMGLALPGIFEERA